MTPDGLTTCPSGFGPKETMDRLAAAVTARGMSIFARIDHAAAAANVGMELRPTELLVFGNPRAGTPLMQAAQTTGVDLPLKALVWEDEDGRTWLAHDDPARLAERHGARAGTDSRRHGRSPGRRRRGGDAPRHGGATVVTPERAPPRSGSPTRPTLARHLDGGAPAPKARLVAVCGLLAVLNLGAWLWALAAFRDDPALLGTALLVYGLGLRHAVDADHIAAIDNVTRKLMRENRRPVSVGLFFALGHSTLVVLVAAAVAGTAGALGAVEGLGKVGGVIATGVSATFLLAVAAANVGAFLGLRRTYRRVRAGGAHGEEDLNALLDGRGFLARILRPLLRLVTESWHMFPLGFLFGLGFDTATEVAVFGLAAAQAAGGATVGTVLVFPVLFAAGMSLVDTTNGVVMLRAYDWAFVEPARKPRYNMTTTLASAVVALLVGGVEALGLAGDGLGLSGGLWDAIGALDGRSDQLGLAIVALLLAAWALSYLIHRLRNAEGSAAPAAAPAAPSASA